MPWPVHPNGLLGAQGDNDNYQISRSLRFNSGDTTYLTRTFGTPTNQNVWTLSVWLKRSAFSSSGIFGASSSGAVNYETIYFDSSSNLLAETWINSPPIQSRNQKTNAVFRDASAWYHFVVVKNGSWASSYPYTIYVNGISQSVTTFDLNTSFVNRLNSSGVTHQIGADGLTTNLFNGYMAEFQFIDGQALTPSSFGETDAITGRWKAKAYSGTYGANGFYLKFADNSGTTSTTLGKDSSPNGNNWTPNNFSVTAGAGNDSLVDSPTNYGSDTGVGGEARGNYCTLNPLFGTTNTIQDGALVLTGTAAATTQRVGTMAVSSGKWYYEVTLTTLPAGMDPLAGFTEINNASAVSQYPGQASSSYSIYQISSNTFLQKVNAGTFTNTNTAVASQGDILGVALDLSSGKIWFSKNGTYVDSGNPATGANAQFTGLSGTFVPAVRGTGGGTTTTITCNFGQRPFAYTAPTGFKALCTTNLTTPTIKKPSSYMDVVTYTGNGGTQTISSLGFSPDLVWVKGRSQVSANHILTDRVRGNGASLMSNSTNDEGTRGATLTSNGFSFTYPDEGGDANFSAATYVAWAWDEAPIAGMDIVSYTGNGANRTIAHNLGVAPKMLIVKARTTAGADQAWPVWHTSIANTTYLTLSTTSATATGTDYWNSTSPTSSVFSVGTNAAVNTSADTYIAYAFAEVEGFSKFGSYTGNGSADGPFVYCGFRPRYILIKRTDSSDSWVIEDTTRSQINVSTQYLLANSSAAEASTTLRDFLSNGFKLRAGATGNNVSGGTYIFAAFAESPFKYARAR